ncbi:Zinc finger CCHC domain containing protein 3 [Dissostichus eleginoides]|uniref:Zinc finger CCHC domain containing protein 3 n=1 Tax=Dissostichus eleginoides TaxID=100907 RepID=A0AAD9B549_DISEL|nr:Zinc finger CCHC domain containing protein 3 [Dissostichus eleginoides]
MGLWTGRRQFQVLLKSEPEGVGGLLHPPALFSLGGDRGYLFYSRQPDFCRRCRKSGHTEGGCTGASCRFCGQGGHEAKDCTVPCHGCGGIDHLYRSCPGHRRTFAEVAGANNQRETAFEDLLEGLFQIEQAAILPVSIVETATVEQGPGGGSGTDSVGQAPTGNIDSPAAASVGVKHGARKGSQAFGTGVSTDNGDCSQVGDEHEGAGQRGVGSCG